MWVYACGVNAVTNCENISSCLYKYNSTVINKTEKKLEKMNAQQLTHCLFADFEVLLSICTVPWNYMLAKLIVESVLKN
jgi:hypothetical protein